MSGKRPSEPVSLYARARALAAFLSLAATFAPAPALAADTHVKAAAERPLEQTSKPLLGGSKGETTADSGPGSRPEVKGPHIPEALRAQLGRPLTRASIAISGASARSARTPSSSSPRS